MYPIILKKWIPINPNRALRRKIEKEWKKLAPLLNIDKAFQKAAIDGQVDYDLIFGFYKDSYKTTANLLFSKHRFVCFDIIENYIELQYGYDKEEIRKSKSTIKILEPIRNFLNK
jgi:hypothetical protein